MRDWTARRPWAATAATARTAQPVPHVESEKPPVPPKPMRVAIAEDSGVIREALGLLLTSIGVDVTGSTATGEELLAAALTDPPDVAIVDMRMPPTRTNEGVVTALALKASQPRMGVLVVTAHDDDPFTSGLFANGAAGLGYMRKDNIADRTALQQVLLRLANGEAVIDAGVTTRALHRTRDIDRTHTLSDRERLILDLMAQGRSNAGIAKQTHVSLKTVEAHIAKIFLKLGLRSGDADNRRVLAVLTWLQAAAGPPAGPLTTGSVAGEARLPP